MLQWLVSSGNVAVFFSSTSMLNLKDDPQFKKPRLPVVKEIFFIPVGIKLEDNHFY